MPFPDDAPAGRALEIAEELGRVTVLSPAGVGYAVRVDRRHVVRHALVGAFVGSWLGGILRLTLHAVPSVVALAVGAVLGGLVWAMRHPPAARWWVEVDRFDPDDSIDGAVTMVGLRHRDLLADVVDGVVADVRAGRLDGLPLVAGTELVRRRWTSVR